MTLTLNEDVIARLDTVDPDRMRAARLADADVRGHLIALYAFHAELAKIPELVSEPMLGQIRYQWWRDCIGEIYAGGSVRAHEVSTPVAEMVQQRTHTKAGLAKLSGVGASRIEKYGDDFLDILRRYAEVS